MQVRAVRRGLIGSRVVEPGEVFDCPDDQLALVSHDAAGHSLGWMTPTSRDDALTVVQLRAKKSMKPDPRPCDGLWPVGHHATANYLPREEGSTADTPPDLPTAA